MQTNSLSARDLVLTLIDSAADETLTARYFIAAGALFDFTSGNVRVALARLVNDGSLLQVERGTYRLGSRAGTLHVLVRSWSRVEDSVKPWQGGWLAVHTAHLTRSLKTQMRNRERALGLYGFAESHVGLWVRPDNLLVPLPELFENLTALGLDDVALASTLANLVPTDAFQIESLWDSQQLEARYLQHLTALADSSSKLPSLDSQTAASETLLLGRAITRDILLDPLLPSGMVDTKLRAQMIDAMRDYDRLGKKLWRAFYQQNH